jgi:hypothetical protein
MKIQCIMFSAEGTFLDKQIRVNQRESYDQTALSPNYVTKTNIKAMCCVTTLFFLEQYN